MNKKLQTDFGLFFIDRCNREMVSGVEGRIPDMNFEASSYDEAAGEQFSGPSEARLDNHKSADGM